MNKYIKNYIYVLIVIMGTIGYSRGFAMDSMVDISESDRAAFDARHYKTTQEKIDAAKMPRQHSWAMKAIHNWLKKSKPLQVEHDRFATHPFKQVVKEAQDTLNIPTVDQIPTIMGEFEDEKTSAVRSPNQIIGNQNAACLFLPGPSRFFALHEATHHKYFDNEVCMISRMIYPLIYPLIGFSCLASSYNQALKFKLFQNLHITAHLALACSGAIGCGFLLHKLRVENALRKKLRESQEHRADTNAAYACECYQCVESAASMRNNNMADGYLQRDELYEIADELKAINKICEYHQIPWQKRIELAEKAWEDNHLPMKKWQEIGNADSSKLWSYITSLDEAEKLYTDVKNGAVKAEAEWLNTPRENRKE